MMSKYTRLLLLVAFCCPLTLLGAESADEHEHEHEKNELAIFVGLTHERRENGAALGLEYERRIGISLGIGFLSERTWGVFDFSVYAVPITFHADRWKFIVAPGIEQSGGHTENLVRVAIGYAFETSKTTITPSLSTDFVGGENIFVLGVAFGRGF